MESLYDQRKVYQRGQLLESQIEENPIDQFKQWLADAENDDKIQEANAMSISTVEPDGCPRTRMVLLKAYSKQGFIFYTNYESRKGKALTKTHVGCIHFFWPSLERQVIIKAQVSKTSAEDSDSYFHKRPRGSQLGAVASAQSSVIPDRQFLKNRWETLEKEFEGKEIKRPQNWGGFLAEPYEIEFWQGQPNRLHDRILYSKDKNGAWTKVRLAP